MDYLRTYHNIINSASNRIKEPTEKYEKHHIIPKCLGGNNDKSNLVALTYREHFICHWLLCKIHPSDYKIKYAFAKLLESPKTNKRIVNSRYFSIVKRNLKGMGQAPWLVGRPPWNKGKKGLQTAWNKGLVLPIQTNESNLKRSETLIRRYETVPHPRLGILPWCAGTKGQGVVKAWNKGISPPEWICPYCNKIGKGDSNKTRWHFDNCKLKPLTA